MIVHITNPEVRKDLVMTVTVSGSYNDRIEISIDQQQPPCGDFKQTNYYILEVPAETDLDKRL